MAVRELPVTAAVERVKTGTTSRTKALGAAVVTALAVGVQVYRLLRPGEPEEVEEG